MSDSLLGTVSKCLRMLPARLRWEWLTLVPLAFISGAAESGAAVAIFALVELINSPEQSASTWWVARIQAMLPWQGHRAVVLQLTAFVVVYQLAKAFLSVSTLYLRFKVASESSLELSSALLRRYLNAPYAFHFRHSSAELIRNCSSAVGIVLSVVMNAASAMLAESLVSVGLIAVLVAASPLVTVIGGLVLIGLVFLLLRIMRPPVVRWGAEAHRLSKFVLQSLQHALGGIKELKVLGREKFFYDTYATHQRQTLAAGYLGVTLQNVPSLLVETLLICAALVALALWTLGADPAAPTLPLLALFAYSGFRLIPAVNRLIMRVSEIRSGAATVHDLYEDYSTLSEGDWPQADGNGAALELRDEIVLENVAYVYPDSATPAVCDITLGIRRGESIGIVGPTGAGKSTLVDLISGLLLPSAGEIRVDGVDLSRHGGWRQGVGYVSQVSFLVDDTLRRNIAFGVPDEAIDAEQVLEAVRLAQLEHVVAALPQGLDTVVGERGLRLSGGERQRVGIARALYPRPHLLVLDEATSSLDMATEAEVVGAIERLRGEKTLFIVSHRLSAVRRCDRLLFLVAGRIAAIGTFEELERQSSAFRAMTVLA